MIGVKVTLTGIKHVDAILHEMDVKLRTKYLKKACEAVVKQTVMPHVVAAAPQGETGNLRAGIKARPIKSSKRNKVVSVGWRVHVGAPAYHASLIELGTRERFNKSGESRGAIQKPSAFAFLRKSLYSNAPAARTAFVKVIAAFVKEQNMKLSIAREALK